MKSLLGLVNSELARWVVILAALVLVVVAIRGAGYADARDKYEAVAHAATQERDAALRRAEENAASAAAMAKALEDMTALSRQQAQLRADLGRLRSDLADFVAETPDETPVDPVLAVLLARLRDADAAAGNPPAG